MNRCTVLHRVPVPGRYQLESALKRGGLFMSLMHRLLNYSPVAQELLIAVYRHEKTAVISEHHTHVNSFDILQYVSSGITVLALKIRLLPCSKYFVNRSN